MHPRAQVIYYALMDDAVNSHLIERGVGRAHPRYVVESACRYLTPLSYPHPVDVGLSITKLGNSSVVYSIGLFAAESQHPAALGKFVHCYINEETGRPKPMDEEVRRVLAELVSPPA